MNRTLIKTLLAVKFSLIIALAFWSKALSIKESSGLAQEEEKKPEAGEETAPQAQVDKPEEAQPETPEAKLLKGVLELPPLDPEKAKKEEIERYLKLVDQARQQIADRGKALEAKEKRLEDLQTTILKKLDGVENERNFFVQTVQREKDIQKERLDKLVILYEKMEPKKAAPIVEGMDKDLVVKLFQGLKEKQVTAIIEGMSSDKAKELSEYFARVGSGREYDLLKEMNVSLQEAFKQECK